MPIVVPWSVEVGEGLGSLLDDDGGEPGLRTRLSSLRDRIFHELGVPLPAPRIVVAPAEAMPKTTAIVSIREIPVRTHQAADSDDELAHDRSARARCLHAIVDDAHQAITARAHELLGIGETQLLLDALEEVNPAIVRQLVPKPISVTLLTDVLRRLVEERISIRDLRTILEGIAPAATLDKDPQNLAEAARAALKRAITHQLAAGASKLEVYTLDKSIEEVVRGGILRTTAGSYLTLSLSATREIVRAIEEALDEAPLAEGAPKVVLVTPDVRRHVRQILSDHREVWVITYDEVDHALQLVIKHTIKPR